MNDYTTEITQLLINNSVITVNPDEKTIFVEAENQKYYILLEVTDVNGEYDLKIYIKNVQTFNEAILNSVYKWLYAYAIQQLENTDTGFTNEDKAHADSLIHS